MNPGDTLPEWRLPITPTLVVSTAIATRDFQDVHHDAPRARELGSQDIFVNILTSTGLVQRYVFDWSGPEVEVRSCTVRLGAPAYPGDDLVFTGTVSSVEGDTVALDVLGTVSGSGPTDGRPHVVSTVTLERVR